MLEPLALTKRFENDSVMLDIVVTLLVASLVFFQRSVCFNRVEQDDAVTYPHTRHDPGVKKKEELSFADRQPPRLLFRLVFQPTSRLFVLGAHN